MVTKRRELVLLAIVVLVLMLGGCVAPPPVPYAPSSLTAIAVSPQQIDLSWKDNARVENGFYVYRRTTGSHRPIAIVGPNTTSYSDSSLNPGTTYWYKVAAYNDTGESDACKETSATTEQEIQSFFDLSTPENTMRSFLEGLLLSDAEKVRKCWSDTLPESYKTLIVGFAQLGLEEAMKEPLMKEFVQSPELLKEFLGITSYEKERIGPESFYVWYVMFDGLISTKDEAWRVVRENGEWRIVGIREEEPRGLLEKEEKEKEAMEYLEKAWEKPDFYGERLIADCPPEQAFTLYIDKGKLYIIPYKEEEKPKTDSSIYSYCHFWDKFDPNSLNTLMINLYNESRFPIEMDYYEDRYYIESYGGNVYQLEIDQDWSEYSKVINPQDSKPIWVKYPSTISKTDIKNVLIRLKKGNIVVGLQKIPR